MKKVKTGKELFSKAEGWQEIFDSISDMVFMLDKDFRIRKVNRAFCKAIKKSPQDLIGRRCYRILHKSNRPWKVCPCLRTFKGKKAHTAEVLDPKLGIPLLVSTSPIFDKGKKLVYAVHIARDISIQKQAEKVIEDLSRFPDENPNPVLRITRNGEIIYKNKAVDSVLKRAGLKRGDVFRILPAQIKKVAADSLRTGRRFHNMRARVGSRVYSYSLSPEKKRYYVNLYAIDITEREKVDTALKKRSQEQEALNDKIREKMNLIQEKDQRLFDTSEELKNTNSELITARDRLEIIVNQMGEGLLVINDKKEIELINDRAKEILGFGKRSAVPEGYKKLFVLQLWKELHKSEKVILKKELTIERPREATLMVTLAHLHSAAPAGGFVAVIRDITAEKKIERLKSDFVANVSHEIRSPMAPMKDALSLVVDGTAGPLTPEQKKFLSILDENMDRLTRLINDLLNLSKIEAGRMELKKEDVKIASLVKDTVDSIKVYAARKKIALSVEMDDALPRPMCDRDRITQVIINLVMNAVKFTPEGGKIAVRCRLLTASGKKIVQVSVTDTGPGMLQEEADLLFNRFKQLVATDKVKGTGLGLAISKAIIDLHGGKIWVESEEGKGSTFKFTLPV
ncbi:MAG: PAS domain S-box protein [Candidatus Omnitrophica bacterium]|nr:PAS domain S-box protein [Candidatus Omnitrophota bacterium]